MLPFKIAGIPCLIKVESAVVNPGSYSYNAVSDYDYYGYCEIEYTVCDRKGYPAPWLAKKVNSKINTDIENMIIDNCSNKSRVYDYD